MKQFLLIFTILSLPLWSMPTGTYGSCKKVTDHATHLKVIETEIEVEGKTAKVYELVPSDGSKYIQRKEGECFNLIVENQIQVPTGIHWHGLILPTLEDGVPYINQPPIPPGKTYPYNFEVVQEGTFWMHSHYGLQEQKLMAAPLILLPKEGEKVRDVVLIFEGFTFKTIEEVWLALRKNYIDMAKVKGKGWKPELIAAKRKYGPRDVNDVDFDAFLTNRKTLEQADVEIVQPGEKIRLRLINGSIASGFHVMLGELEGKIIAVDGNPVVPISFKEFPIATAQRVDVLVTIPKQGGIFPILAQCQGTNQRTGLILKTEGEKTPKISSRAKTTVSEITNSIERVLRAESPLKTRKVDRTIKAELSGNMKYYVWAINRHVWPNDQPLWVKEGERVEIVFTNRSNMAHPMHLHGHIFQVVEIDGEKFSGAMRDTILVMPFQTVKIQFDANNPGIWSFHCHISYHLWGGMFTVVRYEGYTPPYFSKEEVEDYAHIYEGY